MCARGARTASAGKVYKAPEERARCQLRTQRRAEPAWGTRGKGLSPKLGAQGAGKSPSWPRGGADTELSTCPRGRRQPMKPMPSGEEGSHGPPCTPHTVPRAPPSSARPGYGRGPARPAVPVLCLSRPAPPRGSPVAPQRGGRDALSRSPTPCASEARHTHPPHGAGTVLAGLGGAGARRRGGSAARLAGMAALPLPAHACAAAGEPADPRPGAGRGGGFQAAGSSGPPPPACLARDLPLLGPSSPVATAPPSSGRCALLLLEVAPHPERSRSSRPPQRWETAGVDRGDPAV